jgi:hypothetical protein
MPATKIIVVGVGKNMCCVVVVVVLKKMKKLKMGFSKVSKISKPKT